MSKTASSQALHPQLVCKVGTSVDNLRIFNPNDESRPFVIDTDIFKGGSSMVH